MVEMMGLEPTTPCLQSRCSSQLSYIPLGRSETVDGCAWWDWPVCGWSPPSHPSSRIGEAPAYTALGGLLYEPKMVIR